VPYLTGSTLRVGSSLAQNARLVPKIYNNLHV
jgi:hypothetical protein